MARIFLMRGAAHQRTERRIAEREVSRRGGRRLALLGGSRGLARRLLSARPELAGVDPGTQLLHVILERAALGRCPRTQARAHRAALLVTIPDDQHGGG